VKEGNLAEYTAKGRLNDFLVLRYHEKEASQVLRPMN
jgi:hypothetical protein